MTFELIPPDESQEPALHDLFEQLSDGRVNVESAASDRGCSETAVEHLITILRDRGFPIARVDNEYTIVTETDIGPQTDYYHVRDPENIAQRTKKANRWWQNRHDKLVKQFEDLETPEAEVSADVTGPETYVVHSTDFHIGDLVWKEIPDTDEKKMVYNTDMAVDVIDYTTDKASELYDLYSEVTDFNEWIEAWSGDFVTGEGVYKAQFENLDDWLDEQINRAVDPLLRRIKTASEKANRVRVIAQVGNHARSRASGTSKQANADLILYKQIRNTIARLQEHGNGLDNVTFQIGEATSYKNFHARDGKVKFHMRHGDDSLEHIGTSSGKRRWRGWQSIHEFDVGLVGHHHVSKRLNCMGRPVFLTGSPKPAGEYAEQLAEGAPGADRNIATVFGVNDDGLTFVFPVDTRDFDGDLGQDR